MTHKHLLVVALSWVLLCASGLRHARADIYTWSDGAGRVNVSNLAPPDGVQVTKVVPETPPPAPPHPVTPVDTLSRTEALALAERVRQLEYDVELAKRQTPPPIYYPAVPTPAPVQYAVASVQYGPEFSPPVSYGCDPSWFGCAGLWGPGFYPAGVVILGAPSIHRSFSHHGGHHSAMHGPGRPVGFRKR